MLKQHGLAGPGEVTALGVIFLGFGGEPVGQDVLDRDCLDGVDLEASLRLTVPGHALRDPRVRGDTELGAKLAYLPVKHEVSPKSSTLCFRGT